MGFWRQTDGRWALPLKVGELPQGDNAVSTFIPVAHIAGMLLHPGASIPFNGQTLTYPDIKLVYWAGGNPNVFTRDLGTSTFAQGTSAHSCLVEVERYEDALPEIKVFRQPPMAKSNEALIRAPRRSPHSWPR